MRVVLLLALLAATANAQKLPPDGELPPIAAPPPMPLARDDLEQARADFHAQRFERALAVFTALYREEQAPELLFEIARCQHALGRADEAAAAYRRYLVALPDGAHA